MCTNRKTNDRSRLSRRDILKLGVTGAGLLALGPFGRFLPAAHGAPQDLTRLVVINAFGGNDTMNMVIPTTLDNYHTRRPKLAIEGSDGLSLNSGPGATTRYVLHPGMDRLAALWADGDVAIVNKVGYPDANLSHFESQDICSTGVRHGFSALGVPKSGWVARYADEHAASPLGAVSVGVGRPLDFVGGSSNPLLVKSLASFDLRVDWSYRNNHHLRLDTIGKILERQPGTGTVGEIRNAIGQAHELADQIQDAVDGYTSSAVYAEDSPSKYLKDVATLIQAGFETRLFFTGYGGFDLHGDQGTITGRHADLLTRLDNALGAFADDLKEMGVWDDTVIVVMTEFGRRNFENGSDGTDHGHGYAEILLGGPVRGGMYGPELTTADLEEKYLGYEVDFRAVYKEVLDRHLGADADKVFPEELEKETILGLV